MTGSRTDTGGLIQRERSIAFTFDGRVYRGHLGDTLASALLANGVRLMGRSFKYHRPRGVLGSGVEEPNALVRVGSDGRDEPNTRATDVLLYEGLIAVSQNRWPSLLVDAGAINQLIARFIPAGFYYKTFFGGPRAWLFYEHLIRRAAGLGEPPQHPDPDAFEHRAAFCDVLVIGAGPCGLAAASAAARAGARVLLVEQDDRVGGSLLVDASRIDGQDTRAWCAATASTVENAGGRVLTRTTAIGFWDHNLVTLAQRLVEPGQPPAAGAAVQRLWSVRAVRVVLATGAVERPLLFANNDLPGVMLSSAVRTYIRRYGVLAGKRVVIATCNDDAYLTALAVLDAGGEVAAVWDRRPSADNALVDRVRQAATVHFDAAPTRAMGRRASLCGVEGLIGGRRVHLPCDLLAVSGGFTAVVSLHMQAGGELEWNEAMGAFSPKAPRQGQTSAGACAGRDGLKAALSDGWSVGASVASSLGFLSEPGPEPATSLDRHDTRATGFTYDVPIDVDAKTVFVDYQNDVTAADIDLAWREGFRSVEHLKRYTTLGMATDQGKTSNLIGLSRLAAAGNISMSRAGLTTFRPPYTPVTLGLLAGEAVGEHASPKRRLPLHAEHQRCGAEYQYSGYWARPRVFAKPGETIDQAGFREARAVRTTVGLTDVSTLAKFQVVGPDAAAFLERICATTIAKLAVGRGRYTFMLREDGLVVDDGTVWRFGDRHYLLTSSTGGADRMVAQLSYVRKVLAPDLRLAIANVQEHFAAAALAGPRARQIIQDLVGAEPPRHMSAATGVIEGVPVTILAASYSGERAFEVYGASPEFGPVWRRLHSAALEVNGALYGLEALELLRIEKGHIEVGAEIDGRRTPNDLGLSKMLNPRRSFIGAAALERPALTGGRRQTLVGLEASDPIPEGAMLLPSLGAAPEGHVTSAGRRIIGDGAVALGLLMAGEERLGQTLIAASPIRGKTITVRVAPPLFHDPKGELYRD